MNVSRLEIPVTGYCVVADSYDNPDSKAILLSLIGWTSNRRRYSDILTHITEQTGMSALVFDYSGHGDSPFDVDKTRPAQHFLEVICVFDWIKENYPNLQINVMGLSYGGYMATQLTKYREFQKLVLGAPAIYRPRDFYSYAPDIRDAGLKDYRKDTDLLAKHPLLARASQFKGNTLVIVHERDEQIPTATTDAFIKTFDADVYTAKGLGHSFDSATTHETVEQYQTAIANWLKS